MNYEETLEYLYNQLPMFQRVGAAAYKANLGNTYAILDLLKNPHNNFKSIHIAGTNGKGSVSHMLASILQEAGYKTGLYTSPHLKDFRERIRINGEMISQQYVVDFVEKYKEDFKKITPSFFEMTVGMAFKYFEDEKVDVAVLETGMGGRLDSTNVVTPEISVITNISYDHTAFLGDTLEKIASEKAGVIKEGIPVVVGEMQEEAEKVFIETAAKKNAPVSFADQNLSIHSVDEFTEDQETYFLINISRDAAFYLSDIKMPLTGFYQLKNLLTTLQSADILAGRSFNISIENIRAGIRNVKKNTGFLGRWLILNKKPLTICDTGHNVDGIKNIIAQINSIEFDKMHFVLGVVNDKDISNILALLPNQATYYFCKANIPRGLDAGELKLKAEAQGLKGNAYSSVKAAFRKAKTAASEKDLVFIGGSTFVVAEVV